jgi:uncharacterized protein (UPF0147 family)
MYDAMESLTPPAWQRSRVNQPIPRARENAVSNTIELLEAIGQDASLRHATREALSQALVKQNASEALIRAAATNDSAHMAPELGHKDPMTTHSVNQFATDDDEDSAERQDDGTGERDDDGKRDSE